MEDLLDEVDKVYQRTLSSLKDLKNLTDAIGSINTRAKDLKDKITMIEADMMALQMEMEHWEEHTDIDECIYNKLDLLKAKYSGLEIILSLLEE